MNISQMRNMIVLKDLPSNILDEAIVILKNNVKIKDKEKIENKRSNEFEENKNDSYDIVIKEAEYIIRDYIKDIEKPKEVRKQLRNINTKYKRLQISSLFLGITTIIGIIISIIK